MCSQQYTVWYSTVDCFGGQQQILPWSIPCWPLISFSQSLLWHVFYELLVFQSRSLKRKAVLLIINFVSAASHLDCEQNSGFNPFLPTFLSPFEMHDRQNHLHLNWGIVDKTKTIMRSVCIVCEIHAKAELLWPFGALTLDLWEHPVLLGAKTLTVCSGDVHCGLGLF